MKGLISAEVRLYFLGRLDWDTEYFTAKSQTEVYTMAREIAKQRKAYHFNCGLATEEAYPSGRTRIIAAPANLKDQIASIKAAIGYEEENE